MPSKEKLEALKKRIAGTAPEIKPSVMDAHINPKIEVTLGDLRAAIEANPGHDNADAYRKACGDLKGQTPLPDARKVAVDKVDLEALLEDGSVDRVREADKNGNPIVRKVKVAKAPEAAKEAAKRPGKKTSAN